MHDFRIFFIGKGSSNYRTLGKARKIPAFLLKDYHLVLEDEWNAMSNRVAVPSLHFVP
jgi:hypothetical protein